MSATYPKASEILASEKTQQHRLSRAELAGAVLCIAAVAFAVYVLLFPIQF